MRTILKLVALTSLLVIPTLAIDRLANAPNPAAIEELRAGKRTDANAAWWGFNEEDSTDALQAAINSGARRVVVPNVGQEWIVKPIKLAGDQELVLEKGVVIAAKRGEYRGKGDSVFTARNISNLTIRGYGATVRMQKEDYIVGKVLVDFGWHRWFDQYEKAEWRCTLSIIGGENVDVRGVTLRDSGGDGIYVGGGKKDRPCKNIHIKDVVCDNNYRQGISIINVDGLLAEHCAFNNTWGTPPSSGVDIEPDSPAECIKNVVFRDCAFDDNYGDGIEVYPLHLAESPEKISVLFENCHVSSRRGPGIRVAKVPDKGPAGLIQFRKCVVENTEAYGIKVQDKSADQARVRFVRCTVRNVAKNRGYSGAWTPIWFELFRPNLTQKLGGVDFVDRIVEDTKDRPLIVFGPESARPASSIEEGTDKEGRNSAAAAGSHGLVDVTGTIKAKNPHGIKTMLGTKPERVTLEVKDSGK